MPSWSGKLGSRTCPNTDKSFSIYGVRAAGCTRKRWNSARKTGLFSRKSFVKGSAPMKIGRTCSSGTAVVFRTIIRPTAPAALSRAVIFDGGEPGAISKSGRRAERSRLY